jgi:hypothetical protein
MALLIIQLPGNMHHNFNRMIYRIAWRHLMYDLVH